MADHDGQIIEFVIRKKGYSLTNLAKELNVNRRSVYNWFKSETLKDNIIRTIGLTIRHDFSAEFSERFSKKDFDFKNLILKVVDASSSIKYDDSNDWKDRYIRLLEKYNEMLVKETPRS
ncbi:hypothetical protein A0256_13355 [Mucilaginibacter sp. PAMC 26640]|nr:hypothetical protein A0256_13355 [Mucilaginibacter sp. PAMC 26640]